MEDLLIKIPLLLLDITMLWVLLKAVLPISTLVSEGRSNLNKEKYYILSNSNDTTLRNDESPINK